MRYWWNSYSLDGKSVSGYLFKLCDTAIVWRSIKQPVVSLFICEAEFMALTEHQKIKIENVFNRDRFWKKIFLC